MAKLPIDIDTGFYESFSTSLADQRCVNLFPQNPQTKGALSSGSLFPTQGIDQVVEVEGVSRGMHVFNEILFSINGNNLFQINKDGSFENKGTISGTERVVVADNGLTMSIVVPSGDSYFFNSGVLTKITDIVFQGFQEQAGGVTSVTSLDGYFVYTTAKEFFLSSLVVVNDGRNFDALDFSTAESKPDAIVRALVFRNELYIFGTKTTEIFRNISVTGFPFQRVNGATIDKGLTSRTSVIEFDSSYVFLGASRGESPAIWRGSIGSPTKISTSAIDNVINNFTQDELLDVFSFIYSEGGNSFVGLTFPNKTFVYDSTSSSIQGRHVWHERSTDGGRYRVNTMADAYGGIYVGDNQGGLIGRLNKDTFTEYYQTVERFFNTIYLSNNGSLVFVDQVKLITESGVGLFRENSSGVNPMITMEYSDKGGRDGTFSTPQPRALGIQGDFDRKQEWNRQGRTYARVFKFTVKEPVKVVILELILDVQGGTDA